MGLCDGGEMFVDVLECCLQVCVDVKLMFVWGELEWSWWYGLKGFSYHVGVFLVAEEGGVNDVFVFVFAGLFVFRSERLKG